MLLQFMQERSVPMLCPSNSDVLVMPLPTCVSFTLEMLTSAIQHMCHGSSSLWKHPTWYQCSGSTIRSQKERQWSLSKWLSWQCIKKTNWQHFSTMPAAKESAQLNMTRHQQGERSVLTKQMHLGVTKELAGYEDGPPDKSSQWVNTNWHKR